MKFIALFYIGADFKSSKEKFKWEFEAVNLHEVTVMVNRKQTAIGLPFKELTRIE